MPASILSDRALLASAKESCTRPPTHNVREAILRVTHHLYKLKILMFTLWHYLYVSAQKVAFPPATPNLSKWQAGPPPPPFFFNASDKCPSEPQSGLYAVAKFGLRTALYSQWYIHLWLYFYFLLHFIQPFLFKNLTINLLHNLPTWTFIEWNPFLFTYTASLLVGGDLIAIWVPSMAPITRGKPAIAANCAAAAIISFLKPQCTLRM